MALTKQQWDELEEQLRGSFGVARLRLGEHTLTLEKRFVAENKLAICVFIDGAIQPAAGHPTHKVYDPLTAKVWRQRTVSLYTPKRKAELTKTFGKRGVKKYFPDLDKKGIFYTPDFNTFATLKRPLSKLDELQLVTEAAHD